MADDLDALGVLLGDDGDLGIGLDAIGRIDELAIHLAGQRGLGETGADGGRQFGDRHRVVESAFRAVGQANRGHDAYPSGQKKSAV